MPWNIQIPSIVIPNTGSATVPELLDDTDIHYSMDVFAQHMEYKTVVIMAIEVVAAGIPGVLNAWIECSPYPMVANEQSAIATAAFFAAIGGGGGTRPPVAPVTEVATGVHATVHTILIPWIAYSPWVRVCVQTPIAAALPIAFWTVTAMFMAGGGS
jgi:hypothetical protein